MGGELKEAKAVVGVVNRDAFLSAVLAAEKGGLI